MLEPTVKVDFWQCDGEQRQDLQKPIYCLSLGSPTVFSLNPKMRTGLNYSDNVFDRRRSYRHSLKITLLLQLWGTSGPGRIGESLDISEDGALLQTDLPLCVGSLLDLRMKLPEEITGRQTAEWRCKGRVVRIAPPSSGGYAGKVGVHFDWLSVSR